MRVVYERAVKNNAVSQLETLKLDGEEQSVLIEGKSEDLPVLIMLHGGPQSPIIYGNGYRGDTPELTEHFLVVYWDCWGCGKNFADNTESVRRPGRNHQSGAHYQSERCAGDGLSGVKDRRYVRMG